MNIRKHLQFALFVFFLALAALPGYGQSTSGDLVGTILDSTGAAVPNAAVVATNVATGIRTATQSNESGLYRLSNLLVGTYDISVTASGFATATLKNVPVDLNKTATANVTLQVGQLAERVEVSEAGVVIDTTTAQVENSFTAKLAQDLPTATVGLGVLNLSLLGSGVASSGGVGAGTGPSVGGQRPRNNNFTVEGIDNNSKSVTGPLLFIPNDAVANFTVLQNQFAPEYGHSSGGQFNTIVKSGTNELHGLLYDYLQNRNLNAVNQSLANQGIYENPRYDQNRLGATLGGPIMKNKWFYFGSYEYNPLGQASSPASGIYAPTNDAFTRLATVPGVSAANLGILKQYAVAPTASDAIKVGGVTIPIGIVPVVAPNYANQYNAVASTDYNLSDKDQLRGRFIYNKYSGIDTAAYLPVFYTATPTTYYMGTFTYFHTFSPSLTNELRIGYNRYNNVTPSGDYKFPGLDQFPNLVFEDINLQLGPDPNSPQFTIQNLYQGTDNVSWIKGKHSVKVGWEFRKHISPQSFTQRSRGDYDYTTLERYLLDLTPDGLAERSVGNVIYYGDQIANYFYGSDTWRLRPNLTINLGLRYEYTTVPFGERSQKMNAIADVPGVLSFGEPRPQKTAFAPRIGLAYSPGKSGKTSIRAGFGMAYDVLYDNIGILSLPPQLSTTIDVEVPASDPAGFLKNGGISPNAAVGSLTRAQAIASTANYIPNQKVLPYSIQWNFGVQRVFSKDYTFEARYLGTRGVHLNVQTRINKMPKVTPSSYLPTYTKAPSQSELDGLTTTLEQIQARSNVVPLFGNAGFTTNLVSFQPLGNSTYHGLATQLNRRFANGLQFVSAYTWSHAIDDSTADFFSTVLTPRRPQDFQNWSAERATSALDRRHRLTFSAIYDLPFFQNRSWFVKNLLGNWQIAPVYTYESPAYATVQSGRDLNQNGDAAGDRAIVNINGTPGTGTDVTALKNSKGSTVAYLANNSNAYYIRGQVGALATVGRNTLATRPINNWDVTLVKRFQFRERYKFELQGQFLNTWNHPQYIPGSINQINSISVTNTGAQNFLTPGTRNFNQPDQTFGSNPRTVQLAAKFHF